MKNLTISSAQSGFALLGVIGIMVVLAILGAMVYQNVNTDITHSGKDVSRVRAEFAAESAVQWALAEMARKRPGRVPFTLATHNADGTTIMSSSGGDGGNSDPRKTDTYGNGADAEVDLDKPVKLSINDLEFPQGAESGFDKNGWIYRSTYKKELSVSSAKKEILSFKVWYPNDSTLRIQGRGEVDGSTANVDLVSTIREIAVPM